jgi:crotonobetainyl-CoA:carnitine CoA-transferase CaiB-like acyl-CoA transferase
LPSADARRPPLDGIRVLDLTRVVAGPICGRMLADLGADVVKVEPPDLDITRTLEPKVDGQSAYSAQLNAGKRSIVVDLTSPDGPDLVARLAGRADVLLENFRPGVLDRFGLGPEQLLARFPRLVYCSITGWGHGNSWSSRRSYAPLVHAQVGLLELDGRLRGVEPRQEVHLHGDLYPGVLATSAVLAALFERERSGAGQHLDVSMAGALTYVNEWAAVELLGYDGPRAFDIWTHPVAQLGDGSLAALVGNPATSFATWIGALDGDAALLDDPRFSSRAAIEANVDAAVGVLRDLVGRIEHFEQLEEAIASTPLLVAEVRSVRDLAATGWAGEVGLFAEIEPGLGVPRAPWRASGSAVGVAGSAPRPGADAGAVLADWLGGDGPGAERGGDRAS